MGHNLCILAERPADLGLIHEHAVTLELEECIHFHYEEYRLVMSMEEFLFIADVWADAKKKALELGAPSTSPHMQSLCSRKLPGKRNNEERFAAEVVGDYIHFHNKSLRIHYGMADFYDLTESMREASDQLCDFKRQKINLYDHNVLYHPKVREYLDIVDQYKVSGEKISPNEVAKLAYEVKWWTRNPKGKETTEQDLQRPTGDLPIPWSGNIPLELDRRYMCALFESVKTWGYADGPFYNQLMPAYEVTNGIYLKGSHRTAAILAAGLQEIDILLVKPPLNYKCSGM